MQAARAQRVLLATAGPMLIHIWLGEKDKRLTGFHPVSPAGEDPIGKSTHQKTYLSAITSCEAASSSNNTEHSTKTFDSYPNLARHTQHSALRQFLTRDVYEQLKDKFTANGVTLEDTIRAGVSLPHGGYRRGVYAGDAESYDTFRLLFAPIIAQRHGLLHTDIYVPFEAAVKLQKFKTNLDPGSLLETQIDPNGDYILSTRMRLARSIDGFLFAPCIQRAERRHIEAIVKNCVSDWSGSYTSVMDLTNKEHQKLVKNRVLFGDPDEHAIAAGFGRDWPDARGFYCDEPWESSSPNLIIWCNAKDHIRIISREKGGNVQAVFSRLSSAALQLETELHNIGYRFAEHRRLGFLNSSPSDIGSALRASVVIKLVRLGKHPQFENILSRLRLEVAAKDDTNRQYSGIFDIGNAEALGKTEVQLINIMIRGVGQLIQLERRLEQGEPISIEDITVEQPEA